MLHQPYDPSLPQACNGCTCDCHKMAGVSHCIPCCGTGRNLTGSWFYNKYYGSQAPIMSDRQVGMTIETQPLLPKKEDNPTP